jgi:hypothetical protein
MSERTYIGIEKHNDHEWHVVLLTAQGSVVSGIFENTPQDVAAFSSYISEHCIKPKICLKWRDAGVFELISVISAIPDIEVILMSEAGFNLQNNWIGHNKKEPDTSKPASASLTLANQLAHCAKRFI